MNLFFKLFGRNLWKDRFFSSVNILGLALGFSASTLIFTWVAWEKSFEAFIPDADRIYQIYSRIPVDREPFNFEYSSNALSASVEHTFSELEAITSYFAVGELTYLQETAPLNFRSAFIDSSFFDVFDLPVAFGTSEPSLTLSDQLILTESASKRLLGKVNSVGQTLKMGSHLLTVKAVLEDLPNSSEFDFEILLPSTLGIDNGQIDQAWDAFDANISKNKKQRRCRSAAKEAIAPYASSG